MPATINHPKHYNAGRFEVIDVIEDWGFGFHLGNVVKYLARAPHKSDELEDLKKAEWYLSRYVRMRATELGLSYHIEPYKEPSEPK